MRPETHPARIYAANPSAWWNRAVNVSIAERGVIAEQAWMAGYAAAMHDTEDQRRAHEVTKGKGGHP
jgi:hypothetical protein